MLWKPEGQELLLLLRSDIKFDLKLSVSAILKLQMLKKDSLEQSEMERQAGTLPCLLRCEN